jgi:enterochelin esterase-like enzyme
MFLRRLYLPAMAGLLLNAISIAAQTVPHAFFRVSVAPAVGTPVSGRLLIFVKKGSGDKEVSVSAFHPEDTWVCAREVRDVAPGSPVEVDCDETAYPKPFSQLEAGTYEAQAVLDVDHNYNYRERTTEDWVSGVVAMTEFRPGAGETAITLDHHVDAFPNRHAAVEKAKQDAASNGAFYEGLESPLLTRFWGRPTKVQAWVILPPGYDAKGSKRYPTVYWTHGFGGEIDTSLLSGLQIAHRMKDGKMPPMIWVMLDESCSQGTHEFADSVNNGPWGTALTTEFIPYLEGKYRMDARRDGRFVQGHSSGGWASLQMEINYPRVFGGTWSTSPDPSDFHEFTNVDLYAPHANVYRRPDGTPYPLVRDKGKVVATFEQFARLEEVLGPYGGQMASFDWVFSPKGPSGAPEPMFDRTTGDADPAVVAYWREHWDLAHVLEKNWAQRGADLKGRIHLIVGTSDTFYLDGAAHKLDAVLQRLGADAHFTFLPDKTHMDLYEAGPDRGALFDRIGQEMWDVARPGNDWKK